MAKQEENIPAVKIVTVEELKKAYPELAEQLINITLESATKPIVTLVQLKEAYPELVEQLCEQQKKGFLEYIDKRPAAEIKEHLPKLYGSIAESLKPQITSLSSKDGFVLGIKDPFAAGALRAFKQLTGRDNIELPCVIPFKDKTARKVIENYLLRARGGCDKARTKAAEEALKKCK